MPCSPLGVHDLPGGKVRAADGSHLALLDQVVECAQSFFDGSSRVGLVKLVEVNPIGLESPQAGFYSLEDIAARSARHRPRCIHRQAELGGQHDLFAPLAKRPAQDRFGPAAGAVNVRGIEQGDPQIERLVDDLS